MSSCSEYNLGELKIARLTIFDHLIRLAWFGIIVVVVLLNSGCSPSLVGGQRLVTVIPNDGALPSDTHQHFNPTSAELPPSTTTPLVRKATPTQTMRPHATITPTSTPSWSWNEAGEVIAPILLYHHVSDENQDSRYYVSTQEFRRHMQFLKELGYTSIPISLLLDAIIHGAELPERPVVITFDDGPVDVYENAFPIMQDYGYTGVLYIVANRLKAEGFINREQIKEMIATGWEVGSHSLTHTDVTLSRDNVRDEILKSRLDINNSLSITVTTFAYPFGKMDTYTAEKVSDYGYRGAVGLGKSWKHTLGTLFYLNRIEIQSDYDLSELASRLPWPGNTDSINPTTSFEE